MDESVYDYAHRQSSGQLDILLAFKCSKLLLLLDITEHGLPWQKSLENLNFIRAIYSF